MPIKALNDDAVTARVLRPVRRARRRRRARAAAPRAGTLEPPRFCPDCGRRMVVQVTPTGWTARCSRHGERRSAASGRQTLSPRTGAGARRHPHDAVPADAMRCGEGAPSMLSAMATWGSLLRQAAEVGLRPADGQARASRTGRRAPPRRGVPPAPGRAHRARPPAARAPPRPATVPGASPTRPTSTAPPTPARSSGRGCRSRRTTGAARTGRCWSSAARGATSSG